MPIAFSDIMQGILTLAGISAGILGILGKKKYQRIISAVIQGIEAAGESAAPVKDQVKIHTTRNGVKSYLDDEIGKITGKNVRSRRNKEGK